MFGKRKICVVTGSRADFGILYSLMQAIKDDPDLQLQVMLTGSQLVMDDQFTITAVIETLLYKDSAVSITKAIGLGVIGFADAFNEHEPDLVVVAGDRYEIFAAACAAMIANIPIAHLHGGESTEAMLDEAMRHSITKMSHLHFVAAEPYRERVLQLGENPEYVFNFGAPCLDILEIFADLKRFSLIKKEIFGREIGFEFGKLNFLVTYHPVTLSETSPRKAVQALCQALDYFPEAHIIFTQQNHDLHNYLIGDLLCDYAEQHANRMKIYWDLGDMIYYNAMCCCDVVLGNSSSGIIAAPVLKKPTVNLGDRQTGRLKASSIIDCAENTTAIVQAIAKALSSEFQATLKEVESLYGQGQVSMKIKEVLKSVKLEGILLKKFYSR